MLAVALGSGALPGRLQAGPRPQDSTGGNPDLLRAEELPVALARIRRKLAQAPPSHAFRLWLDVYVEVEPASDEGPGAAEVFVRDRGTGFDPDAVSDDRHGLADSVHARMRRHGGTVRIRTGAGEGTEVRLSMPLTEKETA